MEIMRPTGSVLRGNQQAYSYLSCGSLAEPYTSMKRYAYAPDPKNANDPTFDNTGRWIVPAGYKSAIGAMASLPLRDANGETNPDLIKRMIDAYKILHDEMPFIPLVQTPRIMVFSEAHWTGWPSSANDGNPDHDRQSLHKVLQGVTPVKP
jgi:peptide/nickel transport system substrate-binding protein